MNRAHSQLSKDMFLFTNPVKPVLQWDFLFLSVHYKFSVTPFILRGGGFIQGNQYKLYRMTPLSYHGYSVSESSSQWCSGTLLKLLCLLSSFLVHYKTFTSYSIIKYLINVKPITSSHKVQAKTFTWPNMPFYARQVTLMHQTKESNKHAPGRVVIYISVYLV